MKTYIIPTTTVVTVKIQNLLGTGSVGSVSGISGVSVSSEEFTGGAADSRRRGNMWSDDDEN